MEKSLQNNFTEEIPKYKECGIQYVPVKTLTVHKAINENGSQLSGMFSQQIPEYYIEETEIVERNGELVEKMALPLKLSTLAEISSLYQKSKESKALDYFDGGLFDCDDKSIRFISLSPKKQQFAFTMAEHKAIMTIKTNGVVSSREVIYPQTTFFCDASESYITIKVVCSNPKTMKTIKTPYLNTTNSVCMGNARIPAEDNFTQGADSVLKYFKESAFAEVHLYDEIESYKDRREFWLEHKFGNRFPYLIFKKNDKD
jgi:hypothetical protein